MRAMDGRSTSFWVAAAMLLTGCVSKGQLDASRQEVDMLREELDELREAANALKEQSTPPPPPPLPPGRRMAPGAATLWDPSRKPEAPAPEVPIGAVGTVGGVLGGAAPSLVWVLIDDHGRMGGRNYAMDEAGRVLGWFSSPHRQASLCATAEGSDGHCALDVRGFSAGEVLAPAASNAVLEGAGFERVETNADFCARWSSWLVTAWGGASSRVRTRCFTTSAMVVPCGSSGQAPCAD